jgi:hypothetical protein
MIMSVKIAKKVTLKPNKGQMTFNTSILGKE